MSGVNSRFPANPELMNFYGGLFEGVPQEVSNQQQNATNRVYLVSVESTR